MTALKLGLTACVFALISANASADAGLDSLKLGPGVGEAIPHQLNAIDHSGGKQDFSSLKGKRGLVLLFSRSVDW